MKIVKFNIEDRQHLDILEEALLEAQNTTLENGQAFLSERFDNPPALELEAYYCEMGGWPLPSEEHKLFMLRLTNVYKKIHRGE
jgi:hypothetical protein